VSQFTRSVAVMVFVLFVLLSGATAQANKNSSYATPANMRTRCSSTPQVAARNVIPPPPFEARVLSVRRRQLPPGEPRGRGPLFKRLYVVTFYVLKGNAVLPAGHRYSQFAYVTRKSVTAPWCYLKGGSGP